MRDLTEDALDWLCAEIPGWEARPRGGRPAADKRTVIQGTFGVLDNGAIWKDLPERYGSKSTVHRWFVPSKERIPLMGWRNRRAWGLTRTGKLRFG